MAHRYWPLFDLRVVTPRLELRVPTDDDLVALADLAAAGVHDDDTMPFLVPWTRRPQPQLQQGMLQWGWRCRGQLSIASWRLTLAAFHHGEPLGVQDLNADDFPVLRSVETGSWLGRAHQGQGYGKEMRAGALHLAFAGLGARWAHTEAWHDNASSLGVTRSLGYEPNGHRLATREGEAVRMLRFHLARQRWEQHRAVEVEVHDLEPCLPLFGLAPDLEPIPDPVEPLR
jgi:RimJ/RimL family protein N-acetyltransferase